MPKLEYPGYFKGGLVGVKAVEPIEHRESFMSIPYKMLMTVDRAQKHPVLGQVISENPEIFSEEEKGDWEQLTLALYIIYEYQKGEESFWKPYLDLMPDVKFFCHWPQEMILATQDGNLQKNTFEYKNELNNEWLQFANVLRKYPEIFDESVIKSDLFYKFYAQVCTRCFGWGLPSTSMIPMADNCNHSDVTVVQEIFNKEMHLLADRESQYFTRTKYMNDFSLNFSQSEIEANNERNIKGRYNKANFEENKKYEGLQIIKESLAEGLELWDVPCVREDFAEDNDTAEESEDEEESKESTDLVHMLSEMLDRRPARMRNLRKGFVFLMDQEKKELQKRAKMEKARKMQMQAQEQNTAKEWWEDEQIYRAVSEYTLQANEWLDIDDDAADRPPYQPVKLIEENPLTREGGSAAAEDSEETDEEFDWFNEEQHLEGTYFNFVNKNRNTVEAGD